MTGPQPDPDEVARARNDDGRDLAEEHAVAAEAAAEAAAEEEAELWELNWENNVQPGLAMQAEDAPTREELAADAADELVEEGESRPARALREEDRQAEEHMARRAAEVGRALSGEGPLAGQLAAEHEAANGRPAIASRLNPSTGRVEYRAYPQGPEHADGGSGAWYAEREQAEGVLAAAQQVDDRDAQAAVGRFLDAHESYMAAGHRAARARDAVANLHEDVRKVDRVAEAAARRAALVDVATQLSGERDVVVARLAEVAAQEPALREKAQGRGYPAQEARTRLAVAAADRGACWSRLNEVNEQLADATEKIGTDDPVAWKAMRVEDQGVLDSYRDDRAAAIARSSEHYADYKDRCQREEAAVVATADQRAAAEAELDARGIDPQQVMDTAERVAAERRTRELVQPSERYVYEQRAAELDAERDRGRD